MSIKELEEILGIKESDKIDCPHLDEFGNCKLGLDCTDCEQYYEDWLRGLFIEMTYKRHTKKVSL
jgi:hypothetical protein